ncbi:MAG: DUF3795 domain-containing protein [archaeon]|nr:DUF3795 domain-containing protein [archaeon]
MKMPEKIDSIMFAPCGMNCQICESHNKEDGCPGCLIDSTNKTKASLNCKIRACLDKKEFKYCGRSKQNPCKLIKKQDKNYKKRYNFSTYDNAKKIKNTGIGRIMSENRDEWACPECDGIIILQNGECSDCDYKKE